MSGFESLSTEALKDRAEREKVTKEAEKLDKKPRFDPKIIADAHKHASKIKADAEKKQAQPRIVQKIVKLEKYYAAFGPELKTKRPKYNPETVSERELDVFIETVERELNSRNADRMTETVWLLGIKGLELLADTFADKKDLDLTSSVRISDIAATEPWKNTVKDNLKHIQIKYSLFETSPEVGLLMSVVAMAREVNEINQSRAMPIPKGEKDDVRWKEL